MDWTALHYLVTVAEAGSLSGAARKLGVSQPTIGRRIEQLEQQLNSRLFNRTPKGLELTHTGDQVLIHARQMYDEARTIERIARGASRNVEGTVRVTMTDMMGNHWLPEKLPEFYRRFPGLRLEVVVENRYLDLIRREADIAIRFGRPEQLDLVIRRSVDVYYGLYASQGYLEKSGTPKNIRDLRTHFFVSYDETVFQIRKLKRVEKMVGYDRILNRSTTLEGVFQTVRKGVGIGITGCYFSDKDPQLVRVLADRFNVAFPVWVVTHAELFKSARIKAVYNFIVEKLEEDAGPFKGIKKVNK